MEIILKEDIVNLGYKNDIVTVKSGYGRNYLIPTGKAVIASPAAKKMLAEDLKQRAHKLEKIKKDAEALAAKLEGVSLKIATKVSSTGTIFGSVGNIQIAEELAKLGHEIDRKIIVAEKITQADKLYMTSLNEDNEVAEQSIDSIEGEPMLKTASSPYVEYNSVDELKENVNINAKMPDKIKSYKSYSYSVAFSNMVEIQYSNGSNNILYRLERRSC